MEKKGEIIMSEERISFHIYKQSPCKKCDWKGNGTCCGCPKQQEYDYYSVMYSEAIEKMARAGWIATVCAKNQCVPTDVTKEQWDEEWAKLRKDYKKVYYVGAEAELNALLEKE